MSAKTNVLDRRNKKRGYYLEDTADLEIGQDEEDAELEEEAGREIDRARLEKKKMDDDGKIFDSAQLRFSHKDDQHFIL